MNRIIASVGMVALGAASVQAQSSMSGPASKWWNVQATVRGFYDDNLNTTPDHQGQNNPNPIKKVRAFGAEISPKVGISLGTGQTTFSADYKYALLYYDHKPTGNASRVDQDHLFNAALNHSFNERYSIGVRDSFVIGQEPDALRQDAAFHTPYRVAGNNIVNYGGIVFNAELTPLLGLELGYNNAWYDYEDDFSGLVGGKNVALDGTITGSLSGVFDRIESAPHLSLLWHVMPDTTASLSYQFRQVSYTADEQIVGNVNGITAKSSVRDNRQHTVYVGLDHQFRPDFYGSIQGGVSYYDYYNDDHTSFGPYGRVSLTYVYAEESSIQAGFQEGRTSSDVVGSDPENVVTDVEASVLYATLRHRIVPHLFGNLNGTVQRSEFNGGGSEFNGNTEYFYEFGASLEYMFNEHFSAHVGYDFDHLDSELAQRSYSRNKVYVGATASF
jgi:hypothetical protein